MYNIKNLIIITLCYPIFSSAQQDTIPVSREIEEVKINAINAVETTPVSFTNISEDEIEKNNLGQDLPYLISLTPSIISSSDGISWNSKTSGTSRDLSGVTYGNGIFAAIMNHSTGGIITSSDGITWVSRSSGISRSLNGITFTD